MRSIIYERHNQWCVSQTTVGSSLFFLLFFFGGVGGGVDAYPFAPPPHPWSSADGDIVLCTLYLKFIREQLRPNGFYQVVQSTHSLNGILKRAVHLASFVTACRQYTSFHLCKVWCLSESMISASVILLGCFEYKVLAKSNLYVSQLNLYYCTLLLLESWVLTENNSLVVVFWVVVYKSPGGGLSPPLISVAITMISAIHVYWLHIVSMVALLA